MAKRIELKSERRLTSHGAAFSRPAFAPDGRIVIEAEERSGRALYLLDSKGRLEGRLVDGAEAALAPDGARVAFTRTGEDGRRALYLAALDDPAAAHRLAGGAGAVWEHPTWSPDGNHVACVSDYGNPGGLRHVWLLDVRSHERRRVTWDPQRSDGHPAFSGDGRALAFDGDDRADDAREIDVYVLDVDTGAVHRLTDGAVATRRPSFVDRRYLVAERRTTFGPTLVVLDRAKRRALPVGEAPMGEREPAVRLRKGAVQVAYVRREEPSQRDAVFLAELRGLKVVSEADAATADAAADAAHAESVARREGLPVLPPQPPGAHPHATGAHDDAHATDAPRGVRMDLYNDEGEAR